MEVAEHGSWTDVVESIVASYWARTGRALQLAQVPGLVRQSGIELPEALGGRKLKDAILQDLSGRVTVVPDPARRLTLGLVPANETIVDLEALFQAPSRNTAEKPAFEIPRFNRSFWTAFLKVVPEGRNRYIVRGPPISFVDIAPGLAVPPGAVPVEPEHIAQADLLSGQPLKEQIYENIRRWAEQSELTLEEFLEKTLQVASKTDGSGGHRSFRSLVEGLSSLSQSELSRISIPLDIVLKLYVR